MAEFDLIQTGKEMPRTEKAESSLPPSPWTSELAESMASLPVLSKNKTLNKAVAGSSAELFLDGFVSGAIKQPVRAVSQLLGQSESKDAPKGKVSGENNQALSHKVGEVAGSIVPFIGLSLLTRGASNRLLGESLNPTITRLATEQAIAGAALGGLFTPSKLNEGESLFESRLKQSGTMAATFAVMSGTARYMDRTLNISAAESLAQVASRRALIGAGSGLAGGVVEAELRSGFRPAGEDVLSSALGYAAFGTLLEGGGTLARGLMQSRFKAGASLSSMKAEHPLLAADPRTTVIAGHSGWYDRLSRAIYSAPPEHTIVVSEAKWLQEANNILASARRKDIRVVLQGSSEAVAASSNVGGTAVKNAEAVAAKAENSGLKPEPLSWEARKQLESGIKEEAARHGQNPGEAIAASLRKHRLVMVGEYHAEENLHRQMGAESMPLFKKAGLTHLAIEHSSDFKGKVFLPDGKIDTKSLPELLRHSEFYDLLNAAKKEGVAVVPVDASLGAARGLASRDLASRNRHMAGELTALLENPQHKVLYWVGNYHLSMLDAGEGPQVAKLMRDKGFALSTFLGLHNNHWRESPARDFFTPAEAVSVPTHKAPQMSKLKWLQKDDAGYDKFTLADFDHVIHYPYQRPSHWD